MKFACDIRSANSAFIDERASHAVARLLTQIAHDLLSGNFAEDEVEPLRDANGNTIGRWHFES